MCGANQARINSKRQSMLLQINGEPKKESRLLNQLQHLDSTELGQRRTTARKMKKSFPRQEQEQNDNMRRKRTKSAQKRSNSHESGNPLLSLSSFSPVATSFPATTSTPTATTFSSFINNNNKDQEKNKGPQLIPMNNLVNNLNTNLLAIILLTFLIPVAESVDCFKCSSRNGSNPACEDPFHNLNSTRITSPIILDPTPNVIYHTPCYAGKKGREGLFPASACIKLTGTFDTTGETLVVRHCALDSGTLTQDTELARMSHCGKFQFEGDLLKGCVLACPEDACNSAPKLLQLDYNKNVMPYLTLLINLGVTLITICLLPFTRNSAIEL